MDLPVTPPIGEDTNYHELGSDPQLLNSTNSESVHASAFYENDDDEDDAPPDFFYEMTQLGRSRRGRHVRLANFTWPTGKKLDNFLSKIYAYYLGKGVYCILLNKVSNALILAFIVLFTTFLSVCVDYQDLLENHDLSTAVSLQRLHQMPPFLVVCLTVFSLYWLWHIAHVIYDSRQLLQMYRFYTDVLGIPDDDMQTIDWNEVVKRLIEAQPESDMNLRFDAFDIANRIMRKDNYLIGMFNLDAIRLNILFGPFKTRPILTKSLEWNLNFTLVNYIFDDDMNVRKAFLRPERRDELAAGLKKRFIIWGIINLLLSPFILVFLVVSFLLRYGEEFHRDPRSLGARQYTPYARFKFREYNEYPHLFEFRLNASHPFADEYMKQFPAERTAIVARLLSFIVGSFAFVLLVLSIVDEEVLLKLEISPGRTVLWYLGLFSAIFAFTRAFIPEEQTVFQADKLMRKVAEITHYMPPNWRRKLHSEEVHRQFSILFEYKVVLFLMEILGVFLVPIILCFSLPGSAHSIVDFVREFTVRKEKIGHICSFAAFDFGKHGDLKYDTGHHLTESTRQKLVSKQGKMEKSFMTFKMNHPLWMPSEEGQQYLDRVSRFGNEVLQQTTTKSARNVDEAPPPLASASTAAAADATTAESALFDSTARSTKDSTSLSQSSIPVVPLNIMTVLEKLYETNLG